MNVCIMFKQNIVSTLQLNAFSWGWLSFRSGIYQLIPMNTIQTHYWCILGIFTSSLSILCWRVYRKSNKIWMVNMTSLWHDCDTTVTITVTPVTSLWHHCDTTVTSLWHHCDITVTSLWHHCDITVTSTVMSLWHHCDITVASLWHHCDITVTSLWPEGLSKMLL